MAHNPGQIGQYKIEKELGEGTFGQVKLGIHIPTGEKVAVKILEKDKILDQSDVERVSREIQILKLIRHPNIIQLYEIIEDKTHLYLIMEFAEGGELFEYIVQKKKLKEEEACKFFQQIVAGVEYIHKLKIVHRDLKPENLLLDKQGGIKIVDFGLSNKYQANQLLKTACGSPCYAAPEMIAGKSYEGLKVDIWSCGVILFAMICGYLPFDEDKTQDLYQKIIDGDYSIPSHVSTYGRDLISRILTTNPDKRISINEIRKHPWYSIYSSQHEPRGIIVGYNKIPIDPYIVELLPKYGQKQDAVVRYLENNKHNKSTTLYYLLLLQHIKSGHDSPFYIGSTKFRPGLLQDDADEAEKERLRKEKQAEEKQKAQDMEAKRKKEIEDLKNFKKTIENQIPQLLVPVVQEVNPRRHREATRGQDRGAITQRGTSAVPQFFNELTERDSDLPKPDKEINEENKERYASRSRTRKTPYQNPEDIQPLPSSVINYHHNRIAERTKKPNLAQLNNTTVISFDDRSASPIKGRRESEIYNQRGNDTQRDGPQSSRRREDSYLNSAIENNNQRQQERPPQPEPGKQWPLNPSEITPKNYLASIDTNRSANRGQQQTDRHNYRESSQDHARMRQSNDFTTPSNNYPSHSPNIKPGLNQQQIMMTDRSNRQESEYVQPKVAQTERESKRNDSREVRGRNLLELDHNYMNHLVNTEDEAPNTKRTMGASTDRYIQNTNTAEKPKINAEDKENQGVTDGMKIHKGPLNLSSVSMKNPVHLMQDILEVVEMLDIKFKPTSKYAAKCEKGSLKFLVEVNFVENFKNMYAIKFYKSTGDSLKYAHLCNCIFQRLNL